MKRVALLVIPAVALLGTLIFSATATAHVEISPAKAPAGKQVRFAFEIGHGCDGAATRALVVQLPKAASDVAARPIAGWKVKTGPRQLTWTGGPLADHDTQEYPFTATLYGKKGDSVPFKAIQRCEGGAETAWIQSGGGASEAEHPAPLVTLSSTAAAPAKESQAGDDQVAEEDAAVSGEPTATGADADDAGSDDDSGSGKSLLLIVIAGLAIGTVAGIIVRARRQK